MLAPEGQYYNYSGCGNTVNCNHPQVVLFIVDCLRYWVLEMHIDGFRFDLASILTRTPSVWQQTQPSSPTELKSPEAPTDTRQAAGPSGETRPNATSLPLGLPPGLHCGVRKGKTLAFERHPA